MKSIVTKLFYHFLAHQDELVRHFDGKFIVMADDFTVAGAFDTDKEAYDYGASKYEPGTFMVQLCIPGEAAYTVQEPRFVI